jgi:mitochondrial fission protein ELM1
VAAVHHTLQVHNVHQQQRTSRVLLTQVAQQIAATPATLEEYQQFAEVVQEAQEQHLEPGQVVARIEDGPFNWLIQLLPDNKDQAYQFVSMLVTIVAAVIAILTSQRTPEPKQAITPDQVEHIIERVIEHQDQQPDPPTTTAPECGKP